MTDILVAKLIGRSLKSWLLNHTEADSTMLEKPSASATVPGTNPFLTHTRRVTSDLASYRSQSNTPIIAFRPTSYKNVIPHATTLESVDLAEDKIQKKIKQFYELAEVAIAAKAREDKIQKKVKQYYDLAEALIAADSREASPAAVKKIQEAKAKEAAIEVSDKKIIAAVRRAVQAEAHAAQAKDMLSAAEKRAASAEAESALQIREVKADAESKTASAVAAAQKKAEAEAAHKIQEAQAEAQSKIAVAQAAAAAAEQRAAAAEAESEKWRPVKDAYGAMTYNFR